MTAQQARILARANDGGYIKYEMERVYASIKKEAENGNFKAIYEHPILFKENQNKLIEDGFTVELYINENTGFATNVISWEI